MQEQKLEEVCAQRQGHLGVGTAGARRKGGEAGKWEGQAETFCLLRSLSHSQGLESAWATVGPQSVCVQ